MATATKNATSLNDVVAQATQLNDRLVDAGKRVGNLYLDGYDKLVDTSIAFQEKLADQSEIDTVKSLVATQVELTRQIASTYSSATRDLFR